MIRSSLNYLIPFLKLRFLLSICEKDYDKYILARTYNRNRYPWLKAICYVVKICKGIRQNRFVTLGEGLTLLYILVKLLQTSGI